jgi:hypothetical protein
MSSADVPARDLIPEFTSTEMDAKERGAKLLDRLIALDAAEEAGELAFEAAERQADYAMQAAFYQKILDVASSGIDRARDSAKYVQVAAAGITGVYTAMLGLVFSASDKPLPLRAVYPAFFLGLALALSVAYLSFLKGPSTTPPPSPGLSLEDTEVERVVWFTGWVAKAVAARRWALRAAVLSFAAGIAFLPGPFISPAVAASKAPAAVEAPTIPESIAPEISSMAIKVFNKQAQAFIDAPVSSPTSADTSSCDHPVDVLYKCSWRTDGRIDRSFFQLALLGLFVIILLPVVLSRLDI